MQDKMLFWTRFGRVLGTVFGAFWTILGGFWGVEKESNFEGEVGSRKSGFRVVKGTGGESADGSCGPNIGE